MKAATGPGVPSLGRRVHWGAPYAMGHPILRPIKHNLSDMSNPDLRCTWPPNGTCHGIAPIALAGRSAGAVLSQRRQLIGFWTRPIWDNERDSPFMCLLYTVGHTPRTMGQPRRPVQKAGGTHRGPFHVTASRMPGVLWAIPRNSSYDVLPGLPME